MRELPVAGTFYRHFKGNLYQVIGIATKESDGEQMVVYQALYGDFGWFVRPLDEFLSPVDSVKYPDTAQKYRFEQVIMKKEQNQENPKSERDTVPSDTAIPAEDTKKAQDVLMDFLDAKNVSEKLELLRQMERDMDEMTLTTIELSLDLLPDEKETMERRLDFVTRNLEQRVKFEGSRLR